jgi:hypothetical protein
MTAGGLGSRKWACLNVSLDVVLVCILLRAFATVVNALGVLDITLKGLERAFRPS